MFMRTVHFKFNVGKEDISISINVYCTPDTPKDIIIARAKKILGGTIENAYIYVDV